jgi:apolipoprotein N-acyltransferase
MKLIGKLDSLAARIKSFTGFKRNLLAFAAGILATLALPPVYLFFIALPAFSILLILLHSAPGCRRAFFDGWWFGVGFFTTNLYWITISLFTDIEQFWWLVPLALLGLPVCIALFIGCMGSAYKWLNPKGASILFCFAALWTLAELARGFLFTGFPWNLMGYAWMFSTPAIQIASVIGVYGMGYLTILVSAAPALFLMYPEKRLQYFKLFYAIIAMWFVIIFWGEMRLYNNPTEYTQTTVRIVQGNIEQALKWAPGAREKNLQAHIDLSEFAKPVDIVIWPETAFPFYVNLRDKDENYWRNIIPEGTTLITGAVRVEDQPFKVFNSLIVINHEGKKTGVYDKNHLVPFGEYVPFRDYLPLPKITEGGTDFSTGDGFNVISPDGVPAFAALICYEAIFPEKAVLTRDERENPQWIVNITNDAWFGISSGPYQHLEMARMRAVEQGLPLVRAANTGMSAMFDAFGRTILKLRLDRMENITHKLPKADSANTVYRFSHNIFIYMLIIVSLVGTVIKLRYNN